MGARFYARSCTDGKKPFSLKNKRRKKIACETAALLSQNQPATIFTLSTPMRFGRFALFPAAAHRRRRVADLAEHVVAF